MEPMNHKTENSISANQSKQRLDYYNNQENCQTFILINTEKKKIQITKIWNKGEI